MGDIILSGSGSGSSGGGGAVTIADGADVAEGHTNDTAVTSDTNGTVIGFLRGIIAILNSVWTDGNADQVLNVAIPNGVDVNAGSITLEGGYNSTQPTYSNGDIAISQFTNRGELKVAPGVSGFVIEQGATTLDSTTPWFVGIADAGGFGGPARVISATPNNTTYGLVVRNVVNPLSPNAPTVATVAATSAQVLASNANRTGLIVRNLSTSGQRISLGFGASAATLDSGITLYPLDVYTMGEFDIAATTVNAIASAASGSSRHSRIPIPIMPIYPALNRLSIGASNTGNTAGTTGLSSGIGWVFAGTNNITISESTTAGGPNTLWFSAPSAGGGGAVSFSAGTSSGSLNSLVFSNASGVSFGLSGSTLTASVQTNYLTTAMQSQNSSLFAATGFTTTSTGGAVIAGTHDTNGMKLAVPAFLTTAMLSNAATVSNIKISAGTLSNNLSALTFADSNGISWGLSGNSVITATVVTSYQPAGAYLTTADLSQNSSKYAGINGAITGGSITVNTSGVSINLPAYLTTAMASNAGSNFVAATAAFNGTNASGTIASNGISVSVNPPGYALQYYEVDDVQDMALVTNITAINTRPIFVPFVLKGSLTNNSLIIQVSRSTSGSNAFTLQAGLYTYANATSINSIGSLSAIYSGSNTGSISGLRYLIATGWGTGATALTPGVYVLALNFSAANTLSMNYSIFGGVTASGPVGFISQGSDQNNTTNTTQGVVNFWGRYTANSAALPTALNQAAILANFSGASQPIAPWFVLRP